MFFLLTIHRSNPRRYSRHAITLQEDQKRALVNRAARRSIACVNSDVVDDDASDVSSNRASGADRICGCVPVNNAATKAFKDMMDLSLLKDGVFIMFAVSNFLTSIGFNAPYVYTVVSESFTQNPYITSLSEGILVTVSLLSSVNLRPTFA